MNYLFRKIKVSLWPKKTLKDNPPLSNLDLENIVSDLTQVDNKISVFLIEDDVDIDNVIAGIASGRMNIKTITYILVKQEDIAHGGFRLEETPGETAAAAANSLHRDIVIATPEDYKKLAKILYDRGEQKDKSKPLVKDILQKIKGELDPNKMKHEMHEILEMACACNSTKKINPYS